MAAQDLFFSWSELLAHNVLDPHCAWSQMIRPDYYFAEYVYLAFHDQNHVITNDQTSTVLITNDQTWLQLCRV